MLVGYHLFGPSLGTFASDLGATGVFLSKPCASINNLLRHYLGTDLSNNTGANGIVFEYTDNIASAGLGLKPG